MYSLIFEVRKWRLFSNGIYEKLNFIKKNLRSNFVKLFFFCKNEKNIENVLDSFCVDFVYFNFREIVVDFL